ncbi:MAG: hypothetical protein IT438_10120 [Phycisphaerales bacterium]|nr:hypothetical protein [Phycisphaerales bacterium]
MPDALKTKDRLAFWIVCFSSAIAGLCAVTAIVCSSFATTKGSAAAAKDILAILLPVIGTWVGTVLAFYFGKENFKTASEQTLAALGQQLSQPAIDAAMPLDQFLATSIVVANREEALAKSLDEIVRPVTGRGYYRIPILTAEHFPLYVVHRQPLDSFSADQCRRGVAPATLTLSHLLADPIEGPRVQSSFALVSRDATLADAKAAMASRSHCQDVFITTNGRDTGAVLAWLTNNMIQDASKA